MPEIKLHDGNLPHPISALENHFHIGGVSLIQAALAHSYFSNPESVREKVLYFPNRRSAPARSPLPSTRPPKESPAREPGSLGRRPIGREPPDCLHLFMDTPTPHPSLHTVNADEILTRDRCCCPAKMSG